MQYTAHMYLMHVVIQTSCWLAVWCMAYPNGVEAARREYMSCRRGLCRGKCNDTRHLRQLPWLFLFQEAFPRGMLQRPLFMGCWHSSSDTRLLGFRGYRGALLSAYRLNHQIKCLQLLHCMLRVHEHSWVAVAYNLSRLTRADSVEHTHLCRLSEGMQLCLQYILTPRKHVIAWVQSWWYP